MDRLNREIVSWTRWIHIYLSMFSFAALLFFAVTGITLNHTDWIDGQQMVEQVTGQVSVEALAGDSINVDKLTIVETLRNNHRITAPLSEFSVDESECSVSFRGPGYSAVGFVDRTTAKYELTITRLGWIAVMNDLHKGRDSGVGWIWLIDISGVLMILVSLTGFVMIFFLKKKRFAGLVIAFVGLGLILSAYVFLV
jgi:uncharacterized protein